MFEWIKKHKFISIIITMIISLLIIIIIPLIINTIYYSKAPNNFLKVGYDISDILGYYGDTLTFIGTVSLGIITIYQNHVSRVKTDEVNRLTLELQKKSMAMAEKNFEKEKSYEDIKNNPKFELKNTGMNGFYMNLESELKNVSSFIFHLMCSMNLGVIYQLQAKL